MSAESDGEQLGTVRRAEGYFEARLQRELNYDQNTVWTMLTDPTQFAQWLAPGSMEAQPGGAVHLTFADSGTIIDSALRAWEPPSVLEYSWSRADEPDRPVRFELSADGANTRLVLTVRIPDTEDIARTCAGWEAHLLMLCAALAGNPIDFPFGQFQAARKAYGASTYSSSTLIAPSGHIISAD